MDVTYKKIVSSPLVSFDDWDDFGLFLDMRNGILEELNQQETRILKAALYYPTLEKIICFLKSTVSFSPVTDELVLQLLKRLEEQGLIEDGQPSVPATTNLFTIDNELPMGRNQSISSVSWKQRLEGASHIFFIVAELCKGTYQAHKYITKLDRKEKSNLIAVSKEITFQLARQELWFVNLITGLVERRATDLLGQDKKEKGFCMVRSFALCAYLTSLGLKAQVVIARPKYSFGTGFKIHVWVEMDKEPLNEVPNVRSAHKILYIWPTE